MLQYSRTGGNTNTDTGDFAQNIQSQSQGRQKNCDDPMPYTVGILKTSF